VSTQLKKERNEELWLSINRPHYVDLKLNIFPSELKPNNKFAVSLSSSGQTIGPRGFDINVGPVWRKNITGRGVVVTILDDGIEYTHPDLRSNYEAKASWDFNSHDSDPMPRYSRDNLNKHGTRYNLCFVINLSQSPFYTCRFELSGVHCK